MTWTELVMSAAPGRGDRPAVTDVRTGEVLTYATFVKRVTHVAGGLRRRGLRYGERVLVDLPPGAAMACAVHAVAWAGGVVVMGGRAATRLAILQRGRDMEAQEVITYEPTPGFTRFIDLFGDHTVEFGPLAGPALTLDGDRVLTHEELAGDLRRVAGRMVIGKDDVVLLAVTDRFKALRAMDMALTSGAHVIVAHDPTLIGCRVLAGEHNATLVVAPYDLARRLLGDPLLRVIDERAFVSSLAL
ncbi:AMP-binding protein [Nonomuraea sp. NBC_01738]|uniref:AMP-binding protein n=1 Tax=Nonomuraea sp. NBC_01738 TaxID=2976003 RepID=UPI002E138618|nr:AMP-binding protein [Nonomuraea sp. NBC_01738]